MLLMNHAYDWEGPEEEQIADWLNEISMLTSESAALAAADALRLTINNHSRRKSLQRITINTLWEHYCREEMPLKEMSTQDAYMTYAKNWILPRWERRSDG